LVGEKAGQLWNGLGSSWGVAPAKDSTGAACRRAFLLGLGIVKEAILPALPGMGVALGPVSTFMAATGLLAGVGFSCKELCDFHRYPFRYPF